MENSAWMDESVKITHNFILPVPPDKEVIHFNPFFRILKYFHDAVVNPLRASDGVCEGEIADELSAK